LIVKQKQLKMKLTPFDPMVLLALIGLLSTSCASVKSTSDYDKSVDFSQYKTYEYYGWGENSDQILNQFDKERIEKAVSEELAKRGMNYVKSGGDAVVALFIVVDQKTSTTAYTNYYNNGPYAYDPGWGWGPGMAYGGGMGGTSTTTYSENDYLVGTLLIDVWDKEKEKLAWQGVGSKTVDENPKNREKNIQKAVAKIMEAYPVEPLN
jgi:hypothetical protein